MKTLADLIKWENHLAVTFPEGHDLLDSLREYREAWENETFYLHAECERLEEERDEAREAAKTVYRFVHDPEGRFSMKWCDKWHWLEEEGK